MRSTRAPTASELQNPPPPTSSTKSGRLFGKTPLGENAPPFSCVSRAGNEQDTLVPEPYPQAAAYVSVRDELSVVHVYETELHNGTADYTTAEDVADWVAGQQAAERSLSPSSFHKRQPLSKVMPRRAIKNTCCCPP